MSEKGAKNDSDDKLEHQKWYHGLRPREAVDCHLKKNGDFVIRASQKGNVFSLSLNVRNEEKKKVDNFVLGTNGSNYLIRAAAKDNMPAPEFQSVSKLVRYYKVHRLPNNIRLRKGVSRPRWMLHNESVVFKQSDKLGSGNFSDVYRGTLQGSQPCAIKVMHNWNEKSTVEEIHKARMSMLAESQMMESYMHKFIVRFFGIACFHPPLMLILELCSASLDSHLRERGSDISYFEKQLYLLEAARGMRYLHRKNCIHRDLAARNCLISREGLVKIADFGLSRKLKEGITLTEKMEQVPLKWMAPECLQKKPKFSFKSDIWAYAVLMFEVVSNGYAPFSDVEHEGEDFKVIRCIRKSQMPKPPRGTPKVISDILNDIWQKNPDARPEFGVIIPRLCDDLVTFAPMAPEHLMVNQITGVVRKDVPYFEPIYDSVEEAQSIHWDLFENGIKIHHEAEVTATAGTTEEEDQPAKMKSSRTIYGANKVSCRAKPSNKMPTSAAADPTQVRVRASNPTQFESEPRKGKKVSQRTKPSPLRRKSAEVAPEKLQVAQETQPPTSQLLRTSLRSVSPGPNSAGVDGQKKPSKRSAFVTSLSKMLPSRAQKPPLEVNSKGEKLGTGSAEKSPQEVPKMGSTTKKLSMRDTLEKRTSSKEKGKDKTSKRDSPSKMNHFKENAAQSPVKQEKELQKRMKKEKKKEQEKDKKNKSKRLGIF